MCMSTACVSVLTSFSFECHYTLVAKAEEAGLCLCVVSNKEKT